jgi:hypothetical protein
MESLEARQLLAATLTITDSVAPTDDSIIAFPDTISGQTSAAETYTLTSAGSDPVNVTNFAVGGLDPANFTVTVKDNLGATVGATDFSIGAGLVYSIEVTFSPDAVAAFVASITFDTDDLALPSATLVVGGAGIAAPTAPEIDVSDTVAPTDDLTLTFPDTTVGQLSAAETFTIANTGDADLNLTNFAVGGADPGEFDVTVLDESNNPVGGSSFTIPAAQQYTISVVFAPTAAGAMSAQITFDTDDADESSLTLDLNGTGIAAPLLPEISVKDTVAPTDDLTVNFAGTTVGEASAYEKFYIKNIGTADLDVTNFDLVGADANRFKMTVYDEANTLVTDPDFTIPAGERYTVYLQFKPLSAGAKSAQITFDTNDADEPSLVLNINGNALPYEPGATPGTALNFDKLLGTQLFSDSVGDGDSTDMYRFKMALKGTLRVELTNLTGDCHLTLLRLYGGGVMERVAQSLNVGTADELIFKSVPKGTYIVKVIRVNTLVNTTYNLRLTADYAGDRMGTARKVNVLQGLIEPKVFADAIGPKDKNDFYTFTTTGQHLTVIRLSDLSDDADLQLLDEDGRVIITSDDPGEDLIVKRTNAGKYYVRVFSVGGLTNYSLSIETQYPIP